MSMDHHGQIKPLSQVHLVLKRLELHPMFFRTISGLVIQSGFTHSHHARRQ